MKSIAIMQPYLFPYVGYFQLIDAVDEFVVHDDVQYVKGGWINRNRILSGGEIKYITLPIKHAGHRLPINRRYFTDPFGKAKARFLRQVLAAYWKSPYAEVGRSVLADCFRCNDTNVARFVTHCLVTVCQALGIKTPIRLSSALRKEQGLSGEDRVLEICKCVGADHYINPPGGRSLYSSRHFAREGVTLEFIQPDMVSYRQDQPGFVSGLSILDVLMWNGSLWPSSKDGAGPHDWRGCCAGRDYAGV